MERYRQSLLGGTDRESVGENDFHRFPIWSERCSRRDERVGKSAAGLPERARRAGLQDGETSDLGDIDGE